MPMPSYGQDWRSWFGRQAPEKPLAETSFFQSQSGARGARGAAIGRAPRARIAHARALHLLGLLASSMRLRVAGESKEPAGAKKTTSGSEKSTLGETKP